MKKKQNNIAAFKINKIAETISKKLTLEEIVKLFENQKIEMVGYPRKNSKKVILQKSLRSAEEVKVDNLAKKYTFNSTNLRGYTPKIHSEFKGTKVEKFLKSEEYDEAIRVAFLRVNNRVKKISKSSLDGAPLMRTVFSKKNPIFPLNNLKTDSDLDEQEGYMHIFEGCILAFRNPPSHDDERIVEKSKAEKILNISSFLMDIVDKFDS